MNILKNFKLSKTTENKIYKIFSISVIIISFLTLVRWDREFIAVVIILSFWNFLARWDFLARCLEPVEKYLESVIDSIAEIMASIIEGIKVLFFILLWIAALCLVLYILRAFVHFLIY